MIEHSIEWIGLPRFETNLTRLERSLESLRPLWEQFGEEFYQEETALFGAAPWTPLSPAYAKQKQARFGSRPILQATGILMESLTKKGASMNVHRVTNFTAEFGSRDIKAMLHHTGTSRMPVRDPLAEPNDDRYGTIAGEYMEEIVKNAGFN